MEEFAGIKLANADSTGLANAARYSVLVFKSAKLSDQQLVTFARTPAKMVRGESHPIHFFG